MVPADDTTVFLAQNSAEACTNISLAFGLGTTVDLGSYSFGCLEDTAGPHVQVPIVLNAPLLCSISSECPAAHRDGMDQAEVQCNSGSNSRLSLCACAGTFQSFSRTEALQSIPLLSPLLDLSFVISLLCTGCKEKVWENLSWLKPCGPNGT
jgi:hypothetical protein